MQMNDPAPDFELPDLQANLHKLSNYLGKIVIVNFWSAECPHSEQTDRYLLTLLENWDGEVILLSIASNQSESRQVIAEAVDARRVPRVLIDSEHVVADLYSALTTPHIFLLDREGILRYRGAVDDITFRHKEATQFFLKDAVESLLNGDLPAVTETPSYGCAIIREI